MVNIIVNSSTQTNPNVSTWTNRNSVSTSSWVTASPLQFRWGSKFTMTLMGEQWDVVADVLSGLESSTSWSQRKLRVHTALPTRWLETRPGSHSWMGSIDRSHRSVLADPSMEIWGCTEGKCGGEVCSGRCGWGTVCLIHLSFLSSRIRYTYFHHHHFLFGLHFVNVSKQNDVFFKKATLL